MSQATAAHNKAQELHRSKNPNALRDYLDTWRRGYTNVTTDYLLTVIHNYWHLRNQPTRKDLTLGQLRLQFAMQRAFWGSNDVELTTTEFRIVGLLIDHIGTFISYRVVYDNVHYAGFAAGGTDGYRTNVRSLVKRIRRKFENCDPKWDWIENYTGFGYRWQKPQDTVDAVTGW